MANNLQSRTRKLSDTISIAIDSHNVLWKTERKLSKVSFNGMENESFVEELEHGKLNIGGEEDVRRRSLAYLKKEIEIDYHTMSLASLCAKLGTDIKMGLSEERRIQNRIKYGKNELTPPERESNWKKLFKNLTGGLQLLLWAGSILSLGAYIAQIINNADAPLDSLYLGIVLGCIVLLLGCFTFYQEYASDKVMESFSKLVPNYANVVRNAKIYRENCKDLVVGDIVKIKFGDTIPADIRIVECHGFKVDNSSLTGESDPQSRSTDCTHDSPMETKNLAFFSSSALEGTATGLVVSVGDNTFIGRIAGLTSGMVAGDTPMAIEIKHFIKLISCVACAIGITFFIASLSIGYHMIEAALFLIGIIVANVPEGLLVTFTVILALTAKKMANKNCLVKQLQAVETLGSCSVICSDKTGTLTQNKMSVSHFWFSNKTMSATVEHVDLDLAMDSGLDNLSIIARLCNAAKFLPDQNHLSIRDRLINGDASESAILRWMEAHIGKVEEYQVNHPIVFSVPFNSTNKYQYSIHDMQDPVDKRYMLVMKGAPERIINFCTKIKIGATEYDLNSEWREKYETVCEDLAGMGERVIGFCELIIPEETYPTGFVFNDENKDYLNIGMTLVGLISMIDPPRVNVAEAVQTCRSAGIKVVMVTGDHPTTAKAIARSVGILSPTSETKDDVAKRLGISNYDVKPCDVNAAVITGVELTRLSSSELDTVLSHHPEIIFARVSPQQKLVIVEAFQRLGKIVAVTGDGVNDSPALKKADIGVAMGISGSDVSKQAADMILLDDNFASIVTGIEEGRLIFDNLKKCIRYLLVANCAELMPFIGLIVLKIPLPMGTIPMLMVNLGTDIMPTISLSYEKAEDDIMKKPPRNPQRDKLVTNTLIWYSYLQLGLIEALGGYFTYFVIMGQNGFIIKDLIGLSEKWDSQSINDLTDSYGQEWTYYSRKNLEHTCWTAFFISVVLCQCGNVLISKTRKVSLFTKIFDNWVIFFAICFMIGLASFLSYTPGMSTAIGMEPIKINWWATAIPFILLQMVWDEIRRLILRKYDWPWYEDEFYY